jgi:hypothetical protein
MFGVAADLTDAATRSPVPDVRFAGQLLSHALGDLTCVLDEQFLRSGEPMEGILQAYAAEHGPRSPAPGERPDQPVAPYPADDADPSIAPAPTARYDIAPSGGSILSRLDCPRRCHTDPITIDEAPAGPRCRHFLSLRRTS